MNGNERRPTARLAVIVTCLVAAGSLIAAFLAGTWAMTRVDGRSLERQVGFAARAIEDARHKIATEQESSTIWDDALIHAEAHDLAWLADNLGVWMHSYFGHDMAFVLDGQDRIIYAMEDGFTISTADEEAKLPVLLPLVAHLRYAVANESRAGPVASAMIGALGVSDFLEIEGSPAIVSVKPIVSDDTSPGYVAGSEYVHVAVRRIDQRFAEGIAGIYSLDAPRIVTGKVPPGPASVPFRADNGAILGYFEWTPYRPGTEIVRELLPTLGLLAIPALLLLLALLGSIWRSSANLEASERRAWFLAFHDTLTGLPNRALFNDYLEHAMLQQRRNHNPLAVFVIDVDDFKQVNDTLGHPAGDQLLRSIGERLVAAVPAADLVARLGGDEFAILFARVEREGDIDERAAAIATAMREPFVLHGESAFVSVSIGIVVSRGPEMGRSEIMRKADIALYRAKARGGRRSERFAHDMDELVRQRRKIEQDLRQALDSGDGLRVVFQPIFAADGDTLVGAEALIRWEHPVHGELSPDVFVGVAEERGLIGPLTDFVIDEVCATLNEADLPWISVNASPLRLHDLGFAESVVARLHRHGLAPSRLQIEITETALIEDSRIVGETLNSLRDAGIVIALDDFGTGYSSMKYLRDYPVDKIKIDQSFVRQLGNAPDADAIVRAFVALARALKKRVVAEGVETADHQHHLAALGCHELQGFHLSRPLARADMVRLVGSVRLHQRRGRRIAAG